MPANLRVRSRRLAHAPAIPLPAGPGAMGAWGFLQLGWRETNLRLAIDEYLPFGLVAGSVYET